MIERNNLIYVFLLSAMVILESCSTDITSQAGQQTDSRPVSTPPPTIDTERPAVLETASFGLG